jgi:hypothetical protein
MLHFTVRALALAMAFLVTIDYRLSNSMVAAIDHCPSTDFVEAVEYFTDNFVLNAELRGHALFEFIIRNGPSGFAAEYVPPMDPFFTACEDLISLILNERGWEAFCPSGCDCGKYTNSYLVSTLTRVSGEFVGLVVPLLRSSDRAVTPVKDEKKPTAKPFTGEKKLAKEALGAMMEFICGARSLLSRPSLALDNFNSQQQQILVKAVSAFDKFETGIAPTLLVVGGKGKRGSFKGGKGKRGSFKCPEPGKKL